MDEWKIKEVESLVGAKAGWTSLVCRESAGRRSRESAAGGELGLVEAITYPEQVSSNRRPLGRAAGGRRTFAVLAAAN